MSRCFDCGAEMIEGSTPITRAFGLRKKSCPVCGRVVYWNHRPRYVKAIFPGNPHRQGVIPLVEV